jgi:hypothetical protein
MFKSRRSEHARVRQERAANRTSFGTKSKRTLCARCEKEKKNRETTNFSKNKSAVRPEPRAPIPEGFLVDSVGESRLDQRSERAGVAQVLKALLHLRLSTHSSANMHRKQKKNERKNEKGARTTSLFLSPLNKPKYSYLPYSSKFTPKRTHNCRKWIA